MKKTKVKRNKNGSLTVYVSAGQAELFMWILSEGEAGLSMVETDFDTPEKGYKNHAIETRHRWQGFSFVV